MLDTDTYLCITLIPHKAQPRYAATIRAPYEGVRFNVMGFWILRGMAGADMAQR